ncbi:MAG: lysozyme inhibitor LprI family protein [Candidatus Acidiferrum sp.]
MRILVLLVTFFALAGTASAQCDDKKTTLDISQCLKAELKKADTDLNRSYQQALKKLKTADAERLRKAQRAWIDYRDAHCKAEFELWDGGTGGQVALPQCMLTLTKARTAEIEETYGR